MTQNVHRVVDPRYRALLVNEDDRYLEAHRAVMGPWAELVAQLPDPCPFVFAATDEGFAARYTGPITARDRETDELGRLGSIASELGLEPLVHRGRRETVLYLSRIETTKRAA